MESADEHSASDEYAKRFAGTVGAWFLEVQQRCTEQLIPPGKPLRILDVGGGHGQLSIPLAKLGHTVTVLGSNARAFKQLEVLPQQGGCECVVGSLTEIPFPDAQFDLVLCFRILPHEDSWQILIKEQARAARGSVIFDYPTARSLNAIAPLLFGAKKQLEKSTRPYRLFSDAEVRQACTENGLRPAGVLKQFFWPMVLHRALKRRGLSEGLEAVPKQIGLTALFGSPVIARFDKMTEAETA